MKYSKPELVELGNASELVLGEKPSNTDMPPVDGQGLPFELED
ncbi:MAG TPA: lasso RiPP family leader peptide-containing protein [Candidatus Angelobacter sp.]|nr:lasso RiPP family leader peptide-containing protein [Candidatus Angelobacter sp.]